MWTSDQRKACIYKHRNIPGIDLNRAKEICNKMEFKDQQLGENPLMVAPELGEDSSENINDQYLPTGSGSGSEISSNFGLLGLGAGIIAIFGIVLFMD